MKENGIGAFKNVEEAFLWYVKSAEMGSLSGMANAGLAYLEGKGCDANVEKGLAWMEKASEKGNGIASLTMGDYYRDGQYVPQDYAKAAMYYERGGIKQKYADAIRRLAALYEAGLGVPADAGKAAELYKLADETPDED